MTGHLFIYVVLSFVNYEGYGEPEYVGHNILDVLRAVRETKNAGFTTDKIDIFKYRDGILIRHKEIYLSCKKCGARLGKPHYYDDCFKSIDES